MERYSPELRIQGVRQKFDFLPPWKVKAFDKCGLTWLIYYMCGKCFKRLQDQPPSGTAEQMEASAVPLDELCALCGKKAWPAD